MLSNSCRYGIRAVIYLAIQPYEKGNTGIKQISKDLDLPTPFLAKILQQLAKQKILSSTKGPHGGFSLQKDPEAITLLDIINTIDGDEVFTNCVIHKGTCMAVENEEKTCPIHETYSKVRTSLINLFTSQTVADLVKAVNKSEKIII